MTQPPAFDIVGLGLNATDTLVVVPRFPPFGGKIAFETEMLSPGGSVATAMVACATLGLRAKYIGTVGDDERGRVQMASLLETGINLDDVEIRAGCPNQTAYILVDRSTGERTVLWKRDECLRLDPASVTPEKIACARMLHIDGHDTAAAAKAARIARERGVAVTADVDTPRDGLEEVLRSLDYLVTNSEFPGEWTRESDAPRALEILQRDYKIPVAAMTLGAQGALARVGETYYYSPGFVVDCVDTTGAGDVFHGAFCYSVLQGMPMPETLEFSNAMAALNCTRMGARGGIATAEKVRALIQHGDRRQSHEFALVANRA